MILWRALSTLFLFFFDLAASTCLAFIARIDSSFMKACPVGIHWGLQSASFSVQLREIESRQRLFLDNLIAQVRLSKFCLNIYLVNNCAIHWCQHIWISGDCLHALIACWLLPVIMYLNDWFDNSFPGVFERLVIINIEVF